MANNNNDGKSMYVAQCKVCNSVFKGRIENLSLQGFNPQQIYDYLQTIQDPNEKAIVIREDIKPSAIRRHIDRHFAGDIVEKTKIAEVQDKIHQSRRNLQDGIAIAIDKINSMSYMVDSALLKLEEIEHDSSLSNKIKYQLTNQYMNTAKGLIESLSKLTGDLKDESTIDAQFFINEINNFGDIVLAAIRSCDKILKLGGELEQTFAIEFQQAFNDYRIKQMAQINAEIPKSKENLMNTFNDGV